MMSASRFGAAFTPPSSVPPDPQRLASDVRELLWFGEDDAARTHLEASRTMAAHAAVATGLKPFPAAAQHALAVLTDPDAKMPAVVEAIERDPAIASRLLRIANSAAYRSTRSVGTIAEAVVRLGQRETMQLVAGVAAMGLFHDETGLGAEWRDHLAGVAAIARVLAEEYGPGIAGQAFLAGLVHDLGKLLSLQVKEIPYESLSPTVHKQHDELHVVERILVGYDHAVLGAHVLDRWQFPATISQVVAWHHQPGRAFEAGGDIGVIVALVRLADALEYRMRVPNAFPDIAFLEELARGSACSYLEIGARTLHAKWSLLVDAVSDTNAVLVR